MVTAENLRTRKVYDPAQDSESGSDKHASAEEKGLGWGGGGPHPRSTSTRGGSWGVGPSSFSGRSSKRAQK